MNVPNQDKKWLFRTLPADMPESRISDLARQLKMPPTLIRLLALRGLSDRESINSFLAPTLAQLPRPHEMKGMAEAVSILLAALKWQQPVTVFGDFDADGVTSTALLSLFFTELGVPLHAYIPDRLTEGYGLNLEAVRKIHADNMRKWGAAGVLLTADCGISDAEVVDGARQLGFKVIVTDHHRPPEQLPRADAILNPLQPGCSFPCKNLAGVGVAFYLALGVRAELMTSGHWPQDRIPNLKAYMDLVAIGTVADQVPVTGCNRIIIKAGLEVMNQAARLGVQNLLDNARGGGAEVGPEDIAFRVAPRINAVGRLGSAHTAVKLMITSRPEKAEQYARQLEDANNARKDIEAGIFAEAVKMVAAGDLATAGSLVLYKNDWHQGVLGIVASRLCDQFCRPTILLTACPEAEGNTEPGFIKGSGRSVEGIDIHAAVAACREMLQRFGGHAGAVGLTLAAENMETFRQRFDACIREQAEASSLTPSLHIDMAANLADLVDREFLASYVSLAPFGAGNPEPVFCLQSQKLANLKLVGANHLRFSIMEDGRHMNGIGFGFGSLLAAARDNPMDLAFTLRLNSYMGQEKWELNLADLRPSRPL